MAGWGGTSQIVQELAPISLLAGLEQSRHPFKISLLSVSHRVQLRAPKPHNMANEDYIFQLGTRRKLKHQSRHPLRWCRC